MAFKRQPREGDVVKLVPIIEPGWWEGGKDAPDWEEWREMFGNVAGTVVATNSEFTDVLTMDAWRSYHFRTKDLEVVSDP